MEHRQKIYLFHDIISAAQIIKKYLVESKGFWRCSTTLRITGGSGLVHHPEFTVTRKKKTFQKLDMLPSAGEGREISTLLGALVKS
jgi:hypothetical protein